MSSQNIRKMVTTAILIALTIVFQLLRPFLGGSNIISTYIIGSLVNLALIVAACVVGLWSGISVAVIAPLIAIWQGHATFVTLPGIVLGNAVLVVLYALFARKDARSLKVEWVRWSFVGVVAALVKYAVIVLGIAFVQSLPSLAAFHNTVVVLTVKQLPQIFTALIAMVLGGLVLPALPATAMGLKAGK